MALITLLHRVYWTSSVDGERSTNSPKRADAASVEDTALKSLSQQDRDKLAMDAWEPSLLRKLLEAQNKLPGKSRS